MIREELIALTKEVALAEGVDPALACAVVEQESAWDTWAMRYEPQFLERYVRPLKLLATESQARATSWGLMQVMGQTARELGFTGPLASLCDPAVGLVYGCRKLARCLKQREGVVHGALLAYNGGANPNYPGQVVARLARYKDEAEA